MISIEEMEKAGLQYGHKRTRNHPKANYFIIKSNATSVSLVNLEETRRALEKALDFIKETVKNNKIILLVGTQAGAKQKIQEIAQKYDYPYVIEKWLGGTLTNFKTLSERIKYLKELEEKQEQGAWENFTKKEKHKLSQELMKLQKKFLGLRNMTRIPDVLLVIDPEIHSTAIREAKRLKIPIVALLDTDDDPTLIEYPIPGNDSAKSAISYVLEQIDKAIEEAKKGVSELQNV
ncbi:MAG: 30S ribosomal protein S2 [Minisyncoccia bacterium]